MGTITVTGIRRASEQTVSVSVEISNGIESQKETFSLLEEFFSRLEIGMGVISRELLCDVEFWSEVSDAYMSACRSFAFTPSSLNMLRSKLIKKGYDRHVAQQAIDHLHSRGYVDEEDIALRRAEIFVGKMWGQTRIMAKLHEEGFGESVEDAVCDYLESVDMVELCARLIDKKYGGVSADKREREKLCSALYRYGYSPSEIRLAIARASNE